MYSVRSVMGNVQPDYNNNSFCAFLRQINESRDMLVNYIQTRGAAAIQQKIGLLSLRYRYGPMVYHSHTPLIRHAHREEK